MATGITDVVVEPYRSNSIILINNNIGTGGASSPYIYEVSLQLYGVNGVLAGTPTVIIDELTPIDDPAYPTGIVELNGVINPYNTTDTITIDSKVGTEVVPNGDGVYQLTLKDINTTETKYINFTILNGILQCRKQYYDLILKNETCSTPCTDCENDTSVLNYIEFNNIWQTIVNYSNYLQLFMPQSTINTVSTDDMRNIYNLIERANNYCVFCSTNCQTCN
jgi:hypothetical protein